MVAHTNYSDDEFEEENTSDGEEMTSDASADNNRGGSDSNAEKPSDNESLEVRASNLNDDTDAFETDTEVPEKDKRSCSNACEIVSAGGGGKDVSARKRLPLRPKTKIDKLRDTIPYPCEAVPKTHLPAWPDLPLNYKIPSVPSPPGAIVFSRGPVARPLLRQTKSFVLTDPLHRERVPATEYNALHDEHADAYLQKPHVRKLLLQQGLIDNNNDVICSQKDFNKFRQYLATIHTDQLSAMIQEGDERWLTERNQLLQLYKYQSMTEGKGNERWLKVQNAAKKNQEKYLKLMQKMEEKKANDALRDCKFRQEKQRQVLQRKLVGVERDRMLAEKRRQKIACELKRRKQLICNISLKDAAAEDRMRAEKCILKRAYNQFLLEWLDAKYQYQADEKSKKDDIERAIEQSLKSKANKRQERVEKYREMLPDLIAERKARDHRIWVIVKRMFMKWLRKVRERKARKPDALHQSLWEATVVMEETLKYLRKESGYEKFDDFILNILRLKEEIKIKLAEEEAEEEKERLKQAQQHTTEEEEGGEEEGEDQSSSKQSKKEETSVDPQAGSGTVAETTEAETTEE